MTDEKIPTCPDCGGEMENIIKDDLDPQYWWKCLTCGSVIHEEDVLWMTQLESEIALLKEDE